MDNPSDDDYDHLSDVEMARSGSERQLINPGSAPSSPPSVPDLRASDRKTLTCPYHDCPKTFTRKARLEEHIRSHENTRLFKCPHALCDKDFLRQSHLNHHVKSAHTNVRDYVCTWDGCGKSFATGTRLRRHLSAHEGREKYRCRGYEGCNETFRKHETLRKHILLVHEHIKPFPCDDIDVKTGQSCTKSFETAEKLERHKRSQHDIMRFSCTDCLLSHTTSEHDVANQVNSKLSMIAPQGFFATYSELQAHIAEAHPPTCQYCPTSFKTLKELTRHLEVQHDHIDPNTPRESTIACTYPDCGRKFTKKGNLMVHIKTVHEKQKDFVCGMTTIAIPEEFLGQPCPPVQGCGRAFGTKASLQDHIRTAHFGLQSMVVEGRRKRKAERSMEASGDDGYHETKKRAPRKDKGVPKLSAFAALTGKSAATDEDRARLHDNLVESVYAFSQTQIGDDHSTKNADSDDDNDDWDQMTSSMTLCGNNMYHNGRVYQYADGQYSPGPHSPPMAAQDQRHVRMQSISNDDDEIRSFEDDAVFANFEHEPEYLNGPIDPVLLRS